jgi:putative ABC transport system permease protein
LRYAWDGLKRRPARSLATAFGVGLATALVVTLLALSSGVTASASNLAEGSGVDLLAASANTTLTGGQFPPITDAHALAGELRHADPNVETASPWLIGELVFANQSLYAATNRSAVPSGWGPTGSGVVGWIPGDNSGIEVPAVTAGPGFPSPADPHYANGSFAGPFTRAIVLDQGLSQVLHAGVGQVVYTSAATPTGPSSLSGWFLNATAFRVVGISSPFWLVPSALLAFGYLSEVQSVLHGDALALDQASLILIHLNDASRSATDQGQLTRAFPSLTVFTVSDILGAVQSVVNLYRTFGTLIGVVGAGVSVLFTTTVLLMSVDDRSREIALLRALGFGPGWISQEIASEGVLLALGGLAVGAPIGYLAAQAINGFLLGLLPGLPAGFSFVQFDASVIASAVGLVLLVGLSAAALPVLRALRLPVAEELRAP